MEGGGATLTSTALAAFRPGLRCQDRDANQQGLPYAGVLSSQRQCFDQGAHTRTKRWYVSLRQSLTSKDAVLVLGLGLVLTLGRNRAHDACLLAASLSALVNLWPLIRWTNLALTANRFFNSQLPGLHSPRAHCIREPRLEQGNEHP